MLFFFRWKYFPKINIPKRYYSQFWRLQRQMIKKIADKTNLIFHEES